MRYWVAPLPRPALTEPLRTTATGAGEQAGTRALTSAHNEVESTRHYVGLRHKRFYLSGESVIDAPMFVKGYLRPFSGGSVDAAR